MYVYKCVSCHYSTFEYTFLGHMALYCIYCLFVWVFLEIR